MTDRTELSPGNELVALAGCWIASSSSDYRAATFPAATKAVDLLMEHDARLRERLGVELATKVRAMRDEHRWSRNAMLDKVAQLIELETRR